MNGGYLAGLILGAVVGLLIMSLIIGIAISGPLSIAVLGPILAAVAVFAGFYFTIMNLLIWNQETKDCFLGGVVTGRSSALLFAQSSNFLLGFIVRVISGGTIAAQQVNALGSSAKDCGVV